MTFWAIGMADPFPDEFTIIDKDSHLLGDEELTAEKLIYSAHKYKQGTYPRCIYMPTRPMMLKIIRACMGCLSVDELWFNRK